MYSILLLILLLPVYTAGDYRLNPIRQPPRVVLNQTRIEWKLKSFEVGSFIELDFIVPKTDVFVIILYGKNKVTRFVVSVWPEKQEFHIVTRPFNSTFTSSTRWPFTSRIGKEAKIRIEQLSTGIKIITNGNQTFFRPQPVLTESAEQITIGYDVMVKGLKVHEASGTSNGRAVGSQGTGSQIFKGQGAKVNTGFGGSNVTTKNQNAANKKKDVMKKPSEVGTRDAGTPKPNEKKKNEMKKTGKSKS